MKWLERVIIYDKNVNLLDQNIALNVCLHHDQLISVWRVNTELWHKTTFCRGVISRLLLMETITLTALTFVSLLDTTCRLWQNGFTSVLLCDTTTLKVQKSISQCLQFNTSFWHCVAIWKWSCESMRVSYSSHHFDTVNGQTYKEFGAPLLVLGGEPLSDYGLLEALLGQGPLSRQDSGDFILDLGLRFSLDLASCPRLLFL